MPAPEGVLFSPDAHLDWEAHAETQVALFFEEEKNGPLLEGSTAYCGFTWGFYSGEVFGDPSQARRYTIGIVVHAEEAVNARYLNVPTESYWQFRKEVSDPDDLDHEALRRLIRTALTEADA